MTEPLKVDDGQVVSMDYVLHVDGKVVEFIGSRKTAAVHPRHGTYHPWPGT